MKKIKIKKNKNRVKNKFSVLLILLINKIKNQIIFTSLWIHKMIPIITNTGNLETCINMNNNLINSWYYKL